MKGFIFCLFFVLLSCKVGLAAGSYYDEEIPPADESRQESDANREASVAQAAQRLLANARSAILGARQKGYRRASVQTFWLSDGLDRAAQTLRRAGYTVNIRSEEIDVPTYRGYRYYVLEISW